MKKGRILWWFILVIVVTGGAGAIYISKYENKTNLIIMFLLGIIALILLKIQLQEERRVYKQLAEKDEMVHNLEELQKAQNENLNNFAKSIGKVVSESVDESMKPIFQDISGSMKELTEGFDKVYKEGLEGIVNNFIVQMNETLGGQFNSWGENIKELCKWQKETTNSVAKLVKNLSNSTLKIKDVYSHTENIIKQLDDYYKKLNTLQDGIRKTFDSMKNCDGLFEDAIKKQEECVNKFNKHEHELVTLLEKFKESTNEYNKAVNNSSQGYRNILENQNEKVMEMYNDFMAKFNKNMNDQIQTNLKVSKDMQLLIDNSAKNLKDVSKKYNKDVEIAINKTFEQFDKSMAQISGHISGTVADINEITVNIPMALSTSFKNMQKQLSEYITAIEDMRIVAVSVVTQIQEKLEKGELITPVELSDIKTTPKKRTRRTKKEIEDEKNKKQKGTSSKK